MNIIVLGAAGFIGTNLAIKLSAEGTNRLTLVDRDPKYFETLKEMNLPNVNLVSSPLSQETNFDELLKDQEIVYHLISTTVPTTSNQQIPLELNSNVVLTAQILDSCVRTGVKRVIFISSGGTVYGREKDCPISEDTATNPITSYGIQKITIEKLLYLYEYLHGLDYRVIRLANPYGPYQRPNGVLGAVTTFTYEALCDKAINVFGDGSVVRDFIYIDDAITAIVTIANSDAPYRTFNVGSGRGTSIRKVLTLIQKVVQHSMNVNYLPGRSVDVPVNFLDVNRYESCFGRIPSRKLEEGIRETANFLLNNYSEDTADKNK